jgi:predicted ATP-binding protein involved in virulence
MANKSYINIIFPKIQFIVSSHGPTVINSVAKEQIRILDNGRRMLQKP